MNKKQSGFSLVEVLLILILAALVGIIGLSVYHRHNTDKSTKVVSKPAAQAPIKSSLFTDTSGEYSFQLPDGWTTEYSSPNPTSTSKPLWLSPSDLPYKTTGQGPNYAVSIDTTAFPGSYADGTTFANFAQFKQINISGAGKEKIVNQELTLNGDPVWKFGTTIAPTSSSGSPEYDGGYQDVNYYYHKNPQSVVDVSMRVYQGKEVNYQGTQISSAYDFSKYLPDFQLVANSFKLK